MRTAHWRPWGSARHDLFASPRPAVGAPSRVRLTVLMRLSRPRRDTVKSAGEIMEILEAFDLTGSLRAAGQLAGCSHHTVAEHVAAREAGGMSDPPAARAQLIEDYLPKLEEWMEHSRGKIRANKAHAKLVALGYAGWAGESPRRVRTLSLFGPASRRGLIGDGSAGARIRLGSGLRRLCAVGVVEPVDPFEGLDLDVVEAAPRAAATYQLGLEQPDLGLGEGVVVGVADRADARCGADEGEAFGEPDRGVLGSRRRCGARARPGPRPRRGRGSRSPSPVRPGPGRCACWWPRASRGSGGRTRR
jgi:hypothetical protein